MTRMLLRAGADVNAATREGITPLALAAVNGSLEATEILLEAGANAKAVLPEGETVLMTAARTGRPEVVKALLAHGADLKARENWYGETALMWAAAENHVDAITVLVEHDSSWSGYVYADEFFVADRLADWLVRHPEMATRLGRGGERRYVTTDDAGWFAARGEAILGRPIAVEKVRLQH